MSENSNSRGDPLKRFALDAPLREELERFARLTQEELLDQSSDDFVEEGELQLTTFKNVEVRKIFHAGEWWFSVIDVIQALTGSDRPSKYWSDLKAKLTDREGFFELSDSVGKLSMPAAADGKARPTDVATTETLFRIIQSIPSARAEPLKRWLARVGFERIQEIQDPEIAIRRAIVTYQLQGRSDDWIEKRIRSIVVRKELTSEWRKRGVQEGIEYAKLTNILSAATFGGVTVDGHKRVKGLGKSHNLRDHMTDLELIFTMLGEKSTSDIAKAKDSRGFSQNAQAARSGGGIAGMARHQLELETGQQVVSTSNFLGSARRAADPERLTDHRSKRPPAT